MPADLEKKKCQKMEPGDSISVQGELGLVCAAWFDSELVCAISSRHDGVQTTLKRRVKRCSQKQDRATLDVFSYCNKNMGAVDLADMKRAWHTCRLRAFKWWQPVSYWIVDSAIINALIMHKNHKNFEMTNSDLWLGVIDGLLEGKLVRDLYAAADKIAKVATAKKRAKEVSFDSRRFKGRHYPEHLPAEGPKKKVFLVCKDTIESHDTKSTSTV